MLQNCITQPVNETNHEHFHLDEEACELVKIHRDGFGVNNDGWINEIFFIKKDHFIFCKLSPSSVSTQT